MKKMKDTEQATKDTQQTETTILIKGKACVQRNLDFSGSQQQYKILVSSKVRVELPAITEPILKLDGDHGRGQDTENLVQLKVGGKILANFNLLKRDQTNLQLIRNVQHILDQRQWVQ